jgi:hypothetical protein
MKDVMKDTPMNHQMFLSGLFCTAVLLPLSAQAGSGYYWELADPLFAYCEKLKVSSLIPEESASFLDLCERTQQEREAVEAQQMEPRDYLASLRKLDRAREKNLWQMHLRLRSAIANDDIALFERIIAMEERSVFNMSGLLPHAVAFMRKHKIEIPYYINPDAVKQSPFEHTWEPEKGSQ